MHCHRNSALLDYDGASGAIQRWYAYGLGPNDIVSQVNVALGTRTTPLPDIQGSIVASLDSGSGALMKVGYLPYGESPAGLPANFGYTGQQIDVETNGLYYFRARHYSPLLGRFMQVDPIGYQGGVHLYAYVGNDPLNSVDASGLSPDSPLQSGSSTSPPDASSAFPSIISSASSGAGQSPVPATDNDFVAPTSIPNAQPNQLPVQLVGDKISKPWEFGGSEGPPGGVTVAPPGSYSLSSVLSNLSSRGALIPNVGVSVSSQEFALQLEQSGFQRSVTSNSNVVQYSNGTLTYVFRPSDSAGTKVDVYLNGALQKSYLPSRY